jgi:general secretion pathway protein L
MLALSTPMKLAPLRGALSEFWRWWRAELAASIPPPLRQLLMRPRTDLILDLNQDGPGLATQRGSRYRLLKPLDLEIDDATLQETLARASRELAVPGLIVRLSPHIVYRKTIVLPSAALHEFRKIVALDLDRQTPFSPEHVFFDAEIVRRDTAANRLEVELALVKRQSIEPLLARLAAVGFAARALVVDLPVAGAPYRYNLLQTGAAAGRHFLRGPRAPLLALVAALLVANLACALSREDSALALLRRDVAAARNAAQVSDKLRAEIKLRESALRALLDRKAAPTVVQLVAEVTRVLPDTVWLHGLELNDHGMLLSGEAPAAAELVARLEHSEFFANARFRAPVVPAATAGRERFEIALDLKRITAR